MIDTNLLCDFCSAPDPVWRYPARSFLAYCLLDVVGESVGDWAACDRCRTLIEANDRRGLARRSVEELIAKHPEAAWRPRFCTKDWQNCIGSSLIIGAEQPCALGYPWRDSGE